MVGPQCPKPFGYGGIVQPFDLGRGLTEDCVETLRSDELDGASAVFADIGNECESVSRRDVEFARPIVEDLLVVGQKPPEKRIDFGMAVLGEGEWHRDGKWISVGSGAPLFAVCERESPS